ncbi:MAG: EF-P lysine aminoacylase EpmA [Pseudomonadota bacterium]
MTASSPWWDRSLHQDRRPFLLARNRVMGALRSWFVDQGFIEVEPGIAQASPGNETHLHAFETLAVGPDLTETPLYLHTSPEFACKKLLAAGETAIFSFAPVFRNRERGRLHSPEFTMLEWYRADTGYAVMMADCVQIVRTALASLDADTLRFDDRRAHPNHADFESLTFAQVIAEALACEVADVNRVLAAEDFAALAALSEANGHPHRETDDWSSLLSRLITVADDGLGLGAPVFVTDYPASEAALAARDAARPWLAERFELYACGVELANGFTELTDADEQRARFETEMAERARIYGSRYPIDEGFLTALDAMPLASGCAMGFDRLIMLATGAPHIDLVRWTPFPGDAA